MLPSRRGLIGLLLPVALVSGLPATSFGASAATESELPACQQYVGISGLPGGGQPLDSVGRAGSDLPAAVQLNIPVAFTPSSGYFSVGLWAGDYVPPFRGASEPERLLAPRDFGNGTGLLSAGLGKPGHGVYLGLMLLSSELDKAYNLQWQVGRWAKRDAGLAFGVQDLAETETGARSFYLAATKILADSPRSPALTLGYGDGRFRKRAFAGFSVRLFRRCYFSAEYDAFQFNGGFVLEPWRTRSVVLSLTLALSDGDRPLIGFSLASRAKQ